MSNNSAVQANMIPPASRTFGQFDRLCRIITTEQTVRKIAIHAQRKARPYKTTVFTRLIFFSYTETSPASWPPGPPAAELVDPV
jgi:hypothetical protein